MRKSGLLAAAALAMMAASPAAVAGPDYTIPRAWAPSSRSGTGKTRAHDTADKARRRQKTAKKSRQQQRRRAKGKA